jgi:hypothetical protein
LVYFVFSMVHFFTFWFNVPREIWQPRLKEPRAKIVKKISISRCRLFRFQDVKIDQPSRETVETFDGTATNYLGSMFWSLFSPIFSNFSAKTVGCLLEKNVFVLTFFSFAF